MVLVPPVEVVHLAEARGHRASLPRAPAVSDHHGPTLRGREHALAAPEIEGLGLGAHDEPAYLGVAQGAAELGEGEERTVLAPHRGGGPEFGARALPVSLEPSSARTGAPSETCLAPANVRGDLEML